MSDKFNVTISLPDMSSVSTGFFSSFFEWIASHKAPMEEEIKKLLQEYARDGHRQLGGRHYENQTGRLRKSTKAEGTFGHDLKKSIDLYVDLSQAPYGEYVIEGHGTWKGDPFIDETIKVLEPKITEIIINFFNEATMEFNRRN